MKIPEFAIKRSVTTAMIFLGILVVGIVSLPQVAIDLLPDISFPSVTVSTIYDGASPKEVETLITEPIERVVSTVQDVKRVTSSSNESSSSVRVEFNWGKNMEEAANDVREKDIAKVSNSFKEVRHVVRVMGNPAVILSVQKQSGQNTVKVVNRIRKRLVSLERELPEGMSLNVIMDSSKFIRNSISQLSQVGMVGGVLAILILFAFLRSFKSIFIISVSIPISIVATFILMHLSNLSINIMTLGGLALGMGMLVDNSIVVLESIFRHRENGESRIEAAINGSKEHVGAIPPWLPACRGNPPVVARM